MENKFKKAITVTNDDGSEEFLGFVDFSKTANPERELSNFSKTVDELPFEDNNSYKKNLLKTMSIFNKMGSGDVSENKIKQTQEFGLNSIAGAGNIAQKLLSGASLGVADPALELASAGISSSISGRPFKKELQRNKKYTEQLNDLNNPNAGKLIATELAGTALMPAAISKKLLSQGANIQNKVGLLAKVLEGAKIGAKASIPMAVGKGVVESLSSESESPITRSAEGLYDTGKTIGAASLVGGVLGPVFSKFQKNKPTPKQFNDVLSELRAKFPDISEAELGKVAKQTYDKVYGSGGAISKTYTDKYMNEIAKEFPVEFSETGDVLEGLANKSGLSEKAKNEIVNGFTKNNRSLIKSLIETIQNKSNKTSSGADLSRKSVDNLVKSFEPGFQSSTGDKIAKVVRTAMQKDIKSSAEKSLGESASKNISKGLRAYHVGEKVKNKIEKAIGKISDKPVEKIGKKILASSGSEDLSKASIKLVGKSRLASGIISKAFKPDPSGKIPLKQIYKTLDSMTEKSAGEIFGENAVKVIEAKKQISDSLSKGVNYLGDLPPEVQSKFSKVFGLAKSQLKGAAKVGGGIKIAELIGEAFKGDDK